ADIDGWIELSAKNKSTEKELVDLSSRHAYGTYPFVVAVVQMRSTIKVGDKIETVQFFHCYKRGVDRVFLDQHIFLEKVALEAPRVLSLNSIKYFSGPYGDDVVFITNDWQTTLLPYYIKSINKFLGIYESAKYTFTLMKQPTRDIRPPPILRLAGRSRTLRRRETDKVNAVVRQPRRCSKCQDFGHNN
ncbi:hypothetical protein GIB67_009126, partial [Kingdonia uniflora]